MNPAITHRHVIVRLLNGPIYQEDLDLWSRLGAEWEKIKGHFGEMGLDVARDDSAGYAYVRQREEDSEEEENWDDVISSFVPTNCVGAARSMPYSLKLKLLSRQRSTRLITGLPNGSTSTIC